MDPQNDPFLGFLFRSKVLGFFKKNFFSSDFTFETRIRRLRRFLSECFSNFSNRSKNRRELAKSLPKMAIFPQKSKISKSAKKACFGPFLHFLTKNWPCRVRNRKFWKNQPKFFKISKFRKFWKNRQKIENFQKKWKKEKFKKFKKFQKIQKNRKTEKFQKFQKKSKKSKNEKIKNFKNFKKNTEKIKK